MLTVAGTTAAASTGTNQARTVTYATTALAKAIDAINPCVQSNVANLAGGPGGASSTWSASSRVNNCRGGVDMGAVVFFPTSAGPGSIQERRIDGVRR